MPVAFEQPKQLKPFLPGGKITNKHKTHIIMKFNPSRSFFQITSLLLLAGALSVQAVNVTKTDTTSMAAVIANWSAVPATTDVGEFGATPSSATLAAMTLGGNLTLGGLQLDGTMNGPLTIASGSTLTLGTSGINMSAANNNCTINCAVAVGTSAQSWNVVSGRTLTLGGTLGTGSGVILTFTGGGSMNIPSLNTGNGTGGTLITIAGGSYSSPNITIQKTGSTTTTVPTAASPVSGSTTSGFYVNGAGTAVNLGGLFISTGNGGCSGRIDAGDVTVTNSVQIGKSTSGSRGAYFQVNGGTFTSLDTVNGVVMSPNNGSTVNLSEFYVSGGTATLGKIAFGASADTVGGTAFVLVKGGNLYIGSGGIVRATPIGGFASTVSLFSGILGATNDWSSSHPIALSSTTGTPFTIQAADALGVARNITLSGVISGASTAPLTKTGGGKLTLSGANTYTGNTAINAGIVNAGIAESAGVSGPFGNQAANAAGTILFGGGTLQYSGANNFDYSGRFGTGAQPISIDTAGQTVTFATALMTGAAGTLTLTNSTGSGKLILSAANTYTGATTNNGGILAINGSIAGDLVVNSGGLLGGIGTVSGAVAINSGGGLAPGASVGTNTVGSLTLNTGSTNNFEFNANPANDQTIVTTSGGLVINGGTFNIYQEGGTTAYVVPGTYNLIQYSGAISGTGTSGGNLDSTWTTVSGSNPHIANPQTGYLYSFNNTGTWITLTIASSVNNGSWGVDSDGNWSVAGNWSAVSGTMPPGSPSDTATFGTGSALRTVTLDANESAGTVNFNNANSFVIADATKTLTLNNSGSSAAVNVTGGTQNSIQTAVSLTDNATIGVSSGQSLSVTKPIANTSAARTLAITGAGTTILSAANAYGPASSGSTGTTLSGGGTLQVGNNNALGAGDVNVTGSSTLQSGAAGLSVGNNIGIGSSVTATVDNNGNAFTLGGVISGSGSLAKIGGGTLTLGANNTYTGGTTISAGTVSISADGASAGNPGSLGAVPASVTANNIILNGGDLFSTATLALHVNRGIGIGAISGSTPGTALIDAGSGTLTVNGVIASAGNSGANNLTVNGGGGGGGTVVLGGANTFSGTTIISAGTLQLANSLALQNSLLNYNNQGGTLSFGTLTAATFGALSGAQNLALLNGSSAAVALTVGNGASTTYSGALSGAGATMTKNGAGTLTLTGNNSYTGTTTANSGTLEITNNGVINGGALFGQGYLVDGGSVTSVGVSSFNAVINAFSETSGTVTLDTVNQLGTVGDGQLIAITGGSFSAVSVTLQRAHAFNTAPTATAPINGDQTSGFYVNGATANVYLGALFIGVNNSSDSARLDAGTLIVTNQLRLGGITAGSSRWNIFQIAGGSFTSLDTANGIVISPNASDGAANNAELYFSGGTSTANGIQFGAATDANGGNGWLIINNSASVYLGSGGIVKANPVGYTANIALRGGTLGAKADWSSSLPMQLSGTSFTIQAADGVGTAHNISLGGALSGGGALAKTGGGTLTLGAASTYSGATTISAGTLALSGSGSLISPLVSVAGGATFDVSGVSFSLGGSQTLSNSASATGTLNGSVTTGSGTVSVSYTPGTPSLTVASGALTLGAGTTFKVDNTSGTPLTHNNYKLISATGGTVAAATLPAVTVGGAGVVSGASTTLNIAGGELYLVVNHPPVANPNTYNRNGLPTWKISVASLLGNATDADGDPLTLSSVSSSTNGVALDTTTFPGYVAYANTSLVDDKFTYTVADGFGGTSSADITLTAGSAAGVGGQINGFTATGGTASMTFAGIPGYKYHVQVSTNLSIWNDVLITNAPAGGVFQFTDSSAPQPDAFYRLMWNGN